MRDGLVPELRRLPLRKAWTHSKSSLASEAGAQRRPRTDRAVFGVRPDLVHAQHVKQRKGPKTGDADSLWLAHVCQFGPATCRRPCLWPCATTVIATLAAGPTQPRILHGARLHPRCACEPTASLDPSSAVNAGADIGAPAHSAGGH